MSTNQCQQLVNLVNYPRRFGNTAGYTPFVMKSINDNDFDSLYINNLLQLKSKRTPYPILNDYNNHLPVMLGGCCSFQTWFTSFNCQKDDKTKNNVNVKVDGCKISVLDKYYLHNSNLNIIGYKNATHIVSFFIENHKKYGNCIVVIATAAYYMYNVYSIDNDKWMFYRTPNQTFDRIYIGKGARALLFDQS